MNDTQTILFGADGTERIVAVETEESEAVLFIRSGDRVEAVREPFAPWMLVADPANVPDGASVRTLEGDAFRLLVTFPDWSYFGAARADLRSRGAEMVAYGNAEKQFLMSSGKTLFKGMAFEDLHRMQIDIETTTLSAQEESSRLLLVAVSDNRGFEEVIDGDEPEILARLVSIVRERDPDVIEGHNFFGFDMPYLTTRAKALGVPLALGRDA